MRHVAICILFTACAAPAAAQSPPGPARPTAPVPTAVPAAVPVPGARLGGADPAPPPAAAPPPSTGPIVKLDIERPFRLDLRVVPHERAAFLESLHDRERWNRGELGDLAGELPPIPGHPAPRVIIDVVKVKGPHKAADVQREARRLFWINVVTCFGLGAYKDQKLHGKTRAVLRGRQERQGPRREDRRDEARRRRGAEVLRAGAQEAAAPQGARRLGGHDRDPSVTGRRADAAPL